MITVEETKNSQSREEHEIEDSERDPGNDVVRDETARLFNVFDHTGKDFMAFFFLIRSTTTIF